MTVQYYSGFDLETHYSNFTAQLSDGSTTFNVQPGDFSSTQLSHLTMAGILGSDWDDFPDRFQAAINAQAAAAGVTLTFSVSFSTSTLRYTVSADGTFQIGFLAGSDLVGMPSSAAPASTSHTGDRTPEHVIEATVPGRSRHTDDFEPGNIATQAIADSAGANVHGISRSTAITYQDWQQQFEPKTACFPRSPSTAWTYRDMIEHCRTVWPLRVVDDGVDDLVGWLRSEGAAWSQDVIERASADYDDHWHVSIRMVVAGRP